MFHGKMFLEKSIYDAFSLTFQMKLISFGDWELMLNICVDCFYIYVECVYIYVECV